MFLIHGLSTLALVGLIAMHLYFALQARKTVLPALDDQGLDLGRRARGQSRSQALGARQIGLVPPLFKNATPDTIERP